MAQALATSENPELNYFASFPQGRFYAEADAPSMVDLSPLAVGQTGGGSPFINLAPVTALQMCVAYNADFPQRP